MQTSSEITARIGGAAAVLGGLLWSAKAFYDRNDAPPWPTDITDSFFFVVPLLCLVGLVGLYVRCKGRLGIWQPIALMAFGAGCVGLVGSIVGLITMTLEAGPAWWLGISWWLFLFGFFLANLAMVFFGNSTAQSGALGRWGTLPILIGSLGLLLILVGDPSNSALGVYPSLALWMLYGFGWAALGYILWARYGKVAQKTAPAS